MSLHACNQLIVSMVHHHAIHYAIHSSSKTVVLKGLDDFIQSRYAVSISYLLLWLKLHNHIAFEPTS